MLDADAAPVAVHVRRALEATLVAGADEWFGALARVETAALVGEGAVRLAPFVHAPPAGRAIAVRDACVRALPRVAVEPFGAVGVALAALLLCELADAEAVVGDEAAQAEAAVARAQALSSAERVAADERRLALARELALPAERGRVRDTPD